MLVLLLFGCDEWFVAFQTHSSRGQHSRAADSELVAILAILFSMSSRTIDFRWQFISLVGFRAGAFFVGHQTGSFFLSFVFVCLSERFFYET